MEIRKTDKSVDELLDGAPIEKSELAAKIQQLHIFFSLLIPDMNHEERQLLDEALVKTYNQKGITHDNASLDDPQNPGHYREMPILGDLYEVLAASPETKRMANILNRLVHGSASSFNQQTNCDLSNKYTVLDISELSGDLLTAGMIVALDFVWDKAKENRTEEKAIFIDECWQLIGGGGNRLAAEYVLEIFKIIRGYGGSAICATQDLNDFFALEDGKYGKGVINNRVTNHLMKLLEKNGIPTHFVEELSARETLVKRVSIVPLEVIVRNIAAGSLAKRLGLEEGTPLSSTVLEFCYKNDELGDPMVNEFHIRAMNFATKEELELICDYSLRINKILTDYLADLNIELVDFKLEFGKTSDGTIVLADEISPDTCRFWDSKTHEKLDKDRFRRDLGNVEGAYNEIMKRLLGE